MPFTDDDLKRIKNSKEAYWLMNDPKSVDDLLARLEAAEALAEKGVDLNDYLDGMDQDSRTPGEKAISMELKEKEETWRKAAAK